MYIFGVHLAGHNSKSDPVSKRRPAPTHSDHKGYQGIQVMVLRSLYLPIIPLLLNGGLTRCIACWSVLYSCYALNPKPETFRGRV